MYKYAYIVCLAMSSIYGMDNIRNTPRAMIQQLQETNDAISKCKCQINGSLTLHLAFRKAQEILQLRQRRATILASLTSSSAKQA